MMAIMYVATSNATTCSVSHVRWEYKVTNRTDGSELGSGNKQWEWSSGRVSLVPNVLAGGKTFLVQNRGEILNNSMPSFSVYPLLYLDSITKIDGYYPGRQSGLWGWYQSPVFEWSTGINFDFIMSDGDPTIANEGDCGGWVTGLIMTTDVTQSTSYRNVVITYNSTFRFKTVPIMEKINIGLSPTVINLKCTIDQDCITHSNLIITNPTTWKGKMYVTYPAVEGVNYDKSGNWVEQVEKFYIIAANTSPTFAQSIKLSGKKPGTNVFSIPILVELV